MRQQFRSSSLNSMVYGVWINGRPLATGALGSALTGVPATQNMHFRVGNVMESMDATLLLRYVDQGKVSLSDPVSRWFPGLAHARQVTLRLLATNTSGYQDYVTTKSFIRAFAANPFRQYSTSAMIRLGTDKPLLFAPGKSWAFSDTNYLLLGARSTATTATSATSRRKRSRWSCSVRAARRACFQGRTAPRPCCGSRTC